MGSYSKGRVRQTVSPEAVGRLSVNTLYHYKKNMFDRMRVTLLHKSGLGYKGSRFASWGVADFTPADLLAHLNAGGLRFGEPGVNIDHIVPMAAAQSRQEVAALNHWTNMRLMPEHANSLKSDALPNLEDLHPESPAQLKAILRREWGDISNGEADRILGQTPADRAPMVNLQRKHRVLRTEKARARREGRESRNMRRLCYRFYDFIMVRKQSGRIEFRPARTVMPWRPEWFAAGELDLSLMFGAD